MITEDSLELNYVLSEGHLLSWVYNYPLVGWLVVYKFTNAMAYKYDEKVQLDVLGGDCIIFDRASFHISNFVRD